jgi:hypothetical protein
MSVIRVEEAREEAGGTWRGLVCPGRGGGAGFRQRCGGQVGLGREQALRGPVLRQDHLCG